MFRAYVMLALALFVGVMFIVDLYILAVYVNIKFGGSAMRQRMDRRRHEDIEYYRKGLGTDYGFGLTHSRVMYFKFYFYPFEGHMSIVVPRQELMEAQIPMQPVMNYISQRVYADFKRQVEESPERVYRGPPVRQGYIWVNYDVLEQLAAEFPEIPTEKKFKRSLDDTPPSLDVEGLENGEKMYVAKLPLLYHQT